MKILRGDEHASGAFARAREEDDRSLGDEGWSGSFRLESVKEALASRVQQHPSDQAQRRLPRRSGGLDLVSHRHAHVVDDLIDPLAKMCGRSSPRRGLPHVLLPQA